MKWIATKKQYHEMQALAYWIADLHYIREKYGADDPEIDTCRKTIENIFEVLDALAVPFWVQNAVICWAENWRRYQTEHIENMLKNRGVTIAA